MESGRRFGQEKAQQPFSDVSDDARHWQNIYATAVVIAQEMQRNGFDPHEAEHIRPDEIHAFFMSCKIYTFEEQLIFDIAVRMLHERHRWSYGN